MAVFLEKIVCWCQSLPYISADNIAVTLLTPIIPTETAMEHLYVIALMPLLFDVLSASSSSTLSSTTTSPSITTSSFNEHLPRQGKVFVGVIGKSTEMLSLPPTRKIPCLYHSFPIFYLSLITIRITDCGIRAATAR